MIRLIFNFEFHCIIGCLLVKCSRIQVSENFFITFSIFWKNEIKKVWRNLWFYLRQFDFVCEGPYFEFHNRLQFVVFEIVILGVKHQSLFGCSRFVYQILGLWYKPEHHIRWQYIFNSVFHHGPNKFSFVLKSIIEVPFEILVVFVNLVHSEVPSLRKYFWWYPHVCACLCVSTPLWDFHVRCSPTISCIGYSVVEIGKCKSIHFIFYVKKLNIKKP